MLITILYILAGFLFFSVFDYVGYNLIAVNNKDLFHYRILQVSIQIVLSVVLFLLSPISAVCFLLLWWFWLCDWMYYFIDYTLLKLFNIGFEKGTGFNHVKSEGCNWAWWTPYGLIVYAFTGNKHLLADELIFQSIIGVSIVIQLFITINFITF